MSNTFIRSKKDIKNYPRITESKFLKWTKLIVKSVKHTFLQYLDMRNTILFKFLYKDIYVTLIIHDTGSYKVLSTN